MTPLRNRNAVRSRVPLISLAVLTSLALAGCSNIAKPADPQGTLVAQAAPMFASDEEAAAAAELAYRNYIDVSDQIARDGGANVERLKPFATPSLYLQVAEEFSVFVGKSAHSSGSTGVDSFQIQSIERIKNQLTMTAYVCLDVTDNKLINMAGADVTPSGRASRVPLEIIMTINSDNKDLALLSRSDVWTGTNFC